ncbi:Aste57867_16834 [Aphanomyces stellatus]|uniref:Aste57867_16834 protein n=1 Tax=Aphanomyces stellatus TaxID=120398 RepID=A0A485L6B8_9STRA|nr:hypothetical protein As57867_016776 [Aphanomyces stellatus]VFT93598.1 Aste57867_16834 [Aphanomyces stellatus]
MARTAALRQAEPIATNQIASIALSVANGQRDGNGVRFFVMTTGEPSKGPVSSFALWNIARCLYLSPTVSRVEATILGELLATTTDQPLVLQCSGARGPVEAFGTAYCHHRHPATQCHLTKQLVLYVLETLQVPSHIAGRMREATCDDVVRMKGWAALYGESIGVSLKETDAFVDRTFQTKGLFLWEDAAGSPVAFAGHSPAIQLDDGVVYRIGPVFVDETERRKGYGSALTAALSGFVLNKDATAARVCLYADAANPASNKAYQNVGYVLHSETCELDFTVVEAPTP